MGGMEAEAGLCLHAYVSAAVNNLLEKKVTWTHGFISSLKSRFSGILQ